MPTPRKGSAHLYIAYDGMLEPLGQSQVLAYQEQLASTRVVYLLSFEKQEDWKDAEGRGKVADRIRKAGIRWIPRRYHKRPTALATSYDIAVGVLDGLWLILRHRIRIVHARSYVPAVVALTLKRLTGVKFVFDMRGFWADERVDGGLWPRDGRLYRVAKWFERRFLMEADHVVSLTNVAVQEMERFAYLSGHMPNFSVIPTCADLDVFRPATSGRTDRFVLGYVGSAGTWYQFDAVAAAFRQLLVLRPDAQLLVINRHQHAYIRERLAVAGIEPLSFEIMAADHEDVPAQMTRMHAGIFFYKPSYSRMACSPTKLGEFLGCGLPCLSNQGVGDMAEILEGERVGVAAAAFDDATLRDAMATLLGLALEPGMREHCVEVARRHFSLLEGVRRYEAVYASLERP